MTVDELKQRAIDLGIEDDFKRTNLFTGERTWFEDKLLEKWMSYPVDNE